MNEFYDTIKNEVAKTLEDEKAQHGQINADPVALSERITTNLQQRFRQYGWTELDNLTVPVGRSMGAGGGDFGNRQ